MLNGFRAALRATFKDGQRRGEFRKNLDVEQATDVLVAQLEGAVMLAKLYGSQVPMNHMVAHLDQWLTSSVCRKKKR